MCKLWNISAFLSLSFSKEINKKRIFIVENCNILSV